MIFSQQTLIKWLPNGILFLAVFVILVFIGLDDKYRTLKRVLLNVFFITATSLFLMTYAKAAEFPIVYFISNVFGLGMILEIDLLNYIFLVFSGFIWIYVSLYSWEEIEGREKEKVFYIFFIITYLATIGTIMAADLLSFFLFFEVITFSAYVLLVHYGGERTLKAGNIYLYASILGGLSILTAIILLSFYTDGYQWINLVEALTETGMTKYIIIGLFIVGFGVKAGMVPFHFWLPQIYREAPTSVNALSSGILTKIGAYGIFRVLLTVVSPKVIEVSSITSNLYRISQEIGSIMIWLGILTMVIGVLLALIEGNMKKMLAFHSISQMGYILMGIGIAAYLGEKGAMGFTGSIYHMINHGFFKALLFMVAGVVFAKTGESNMYKLGGLWRKMPFTAFIGLVGVLGITGAPGLNGYASKSILHHAIVEAYTYGHSSFRYAEMIFMIVSAGTVCSFLKFFRFIFLGKSSLQYEQIQSYSLSRKVSMGCLSILILLIGLKPNFLLDQFIIPSLLDFTFDFQLIEKYMIHMNFWNIKDIMSIFLVFIIGCGMYIVGVKYNLFHYSLPKWMNIEKRFYQPIAQLGNEFPAFYVKRYEQIMVHSDVLIYVFLLTIILASLVFFGI